MLRPKNPAAEALLCLIMSDTSAAAVQGSGQQQRALAKLVASQPSFRSIATLVDVQNRAPHRRAGHLGPGALPLLGTLRSVASVPQLNSDAPRQSCSPCAMPVVSTFGLHRQGHDAVRLQGSGSFHPDLHVCSSPSAPLMAANGGPSRWRQRPMVSGPSGPPETAGGRATDGEGKRAAQDGELTAGDMSISRSSRCAMLRSPDLPNPDEGAMHSCACSGGSSSSRIRTCSKDSKTPRSTVEPTSRDNDARSSESDSDSSSSFSESSAESEPVKSPPVLAGPPMRRRLSLSAVSNVKPDLLGLGASSVGGASPAPLVRARRMSLPANLSPSLVLGGLGSELPMASSLSLGTRYPAMGHKASCAPVRRRSVSIQDNFRSLPPAERFRAVLSQRFGSLRKAFKALDKGGTGVLSCARLKQRLAELGMKVEDVSGLRSATALFKEFDKQGAGTITISEFIGDSAECPPPDDQDEWQYLTTAEKWVRWCERTPGDPAPGSRLRAPVWHSRPDEAMTAIKELEEKRAKDLHRIRTMMAQGIHKTERGLKLTAPHLLPVADDDTVDQYRREALETVELSSKRIRLALQESTRCRHDIQGCTQALRGVEEEARRAECKEFLAQQRRRMLSTRGSAARFRVSTVLTLDALNVFSEGKGANKMKP